MNLKDKIAVVTGGSSGIGQAICIALAKEGCKVLFTYNSNKDGADKTTKETSGAGVGFKVNLESGDERAKLVEFLKKEYKKIDILVNSAGSNKEDGLFNLESWRNIFELDLFAVVAVTGAIKDLMGDGGRILNLSSVYSEGKAAWKGLPAYSAAKAAIDNFTQTSAKNLAPKILVNAISPGYVDTPMWENNTEENKKTLGMDLLTERFIKPEEIAQMAVAIIKNDSMTGEIVVVDGGISLKTV